MGGRHAATTQVGCPQDPKENSFPAQKGTHAANLMLASSNKACPPVFHTFEKAVQTHPLAPCSRLLAGGTRAAEARKKNGQKSRKWRLARACQSATSRAVRGDIQALSGLFTVFSHPLCTHISPPCRHMPALGPPPRPGPDHHASSNTPRDLQMLHTRPKGGQTVCRGT